MSSREKRWNRSMAVNLLLGTLLISATVMIHTLGLVLLTHGMTHLVRQLRLHRHGVGKSMAMVTTVLGLFLVHTVEVWLWAGAYLVLGAVANFETALYFSITTFATVGFGDVLVREEWRLFAALEGVNGFLLIGWSTAYLVAASTRHGPFRIGEHF
jgi:hypothetical protein